MSLDRAEQTKHRETQRHVDFRQASTPKPSIQVGSQVRLTGVVTGVSEQLEVATMDVDGSTSEVEADFSALEVIRQPFKRGEVVYHVGDPDSEVRTVVTDEKNGHVLLARHLHGSEVMVWSVEDFERRP